MADPRVSGPPPGVAEGEQRAQIRGSSALALGRVISLSINLVVQVVSVRALTKAEYGAFAYAMSLVPLVGLIVTLGTSKATSRFVSLYRERNERDLLAGLIVLQSVGFVVLGAMTWFVLAQERVGEALFSDDTIRSVMLVAVLIAPIEALDDLFESIFAGFSQARAIFFRKYLMGPVLKLGAVSVVALTGGGPVDLAVGYVVGGLLGMLTYVGLGLRLLRQEGLLGYFRPSRFSMPVVALLAFSVPLLTGEALHISMNTFSVIVLEHQGGAEAVAEYRAVFPLARLNHFVMWAFAVLFVPMAARFFARDDRRAMRESYWMTAAWIAVFTFPVFAATGPLAGTTSELLFGDEYAGSGPVLAALAVGYYVNAIFAFNALTLQTWGLVAWVSAVNVVAAGVNAVLLLSLAPRMGAFGVGIANAATLIGVNVVNQIRLHRLIGIGLVPTGSGRLYVRLTLAALLILAFDRILTPPGLASLVFAGVVSLVVLRLSRSDIAAGDTLPEVRRLPVLKWFV